MIVIHNPDDNGKIRFLWYKGNLYRYDDLEDFVRIILIVMASMEDED